MHQCKRDQQHACMQCFKIYTKRDCGLLLWLALFDDAWSFFTDAASTMPVICPACCVHALLQELTADLPERSLLLLGKQNILRKAAVYAITNKYFDYAMLATIVANCVTLGMYSHQPGFDESQLGQFLQAADYFFLGVFSLEMLLKVLAMGLVLAPGTYLRSGEPRGEQHNKHSKPWNEAISCLHAHALAVNAGCSWVAATVALRCYARLMQCSCLASMGSCRLMLPCIALQAGTFWMAQWWHWAMWTCS